MNFLKRVNPKGTAEIHVKKSEFIYMYEQQDNINPVFMAGADKTHCNSIR